MWEQSDLKKDFGHREVNENYLVLSGYTFKSALATQASNKAERRGIIDIHLTKRQKNNLDIDTIKIVKETKGISTSLKDKISQIKSSLEKFDIKPASQSVE